jgi:hypothetical protein
VKLLEALHDFALPRVEDNHRDKSNGGESMKAKTMVAETKANQPKATVVAGQHRRGYHVAMTQVTQNGATTIEEIRVVPDELYAPSRLPRVHECSAYDAAISNLYRDQNGFHLTVDRGPGGFQLDLPPTLPEIAKIQSLVAHWQLEPALREQIAQGLAKQAEAAKR